MGAVTGAHVLLNEVIKPKMRPPNRPIVKAGPAKLMSRVCINEFHVQDAVSTAQSSKMPVLLMVPFRVMRCAASMRLPPYWLPWKSLKVFFPRAGFDVFISGIAISPSPNAGLGIARAEQGPGFAG